MRKAQRDIVQRVLQQSHVTIRASKEADSSATDAVKPPDPPVDKPAKSKSIKKEPAPAPASPQKVVRNIDGALAPAVLSYLQHNGYSASASAMRKDMGSRKRLLETGFGELSESRAKKLARTEAWHEAQEATWRELQQIKTDYRENRIASVWHKLETTLRSTGSPPFLASEALWACRMRIRYFYCIVRENLLKGDAENDAASHSAISLPELSADDGFKQFMLGDHKLQPTTPEGSEYDASGVLVAVGSHLQAEHGQSPNGILQHELETALSYMAYARMSDLPKGMFSNISPTALSQEADELIKAIRGKLTRYRAVTISLLNLLFFSGSLSRKARFQRFGDGFQLSRWQLDGPGKIAQCLCRYVPKRTGSYSAPRLEEESASRINVSINPVSRLVTPTSSVSDICICSRRIFVSSS